MKPAKHKKLLLVLLFSGTILATFLLYGNDDHSDLIQVEPDDPLEYSDATIYGMLRLTEGIDGNRNGMTKHDLYIEIDYIQVGSVTKPYVEKSFDPSDYEPLTWKTLKSNILDEADNYAGLTDIPQIFKSKTLKSKIIISGRIYKHCMDTYYLSPVEEKKPEEAFSCWDATEQHHIRLSEYSKK